MTTVIRVPDQFSPGAGSAATAATPTCCCCCCCVVAVAATSAVLAEGLNADLRAVERRSTAAVVLIACGPAIAVAPIPIAYLWADSLAAWWLESHLGTALLIAVLAAAGWTFGISLASGARRPWAALPRLAAGTVLAFAEFVVALYTFMLAEVVGWLLIPVVLMGVRRFYRRADRR